MLTVAKVKSGVRKRKLKISDLMQLTSKLEKKWEK